MIGFGASTPTIVTDVDAPHANPEVLPSVERPAEMDARELACIEAVIARGHRTFVEVGEALLAIRERARATERLAL